MTCLEECFSTKPVSEMVASDHDVDVAVVGAGPGGLACAAAFIAAFGSSSRIKVCVLLCCLIHVCERTHRHFKCLGDQAGV